MAQGGCLNRWPWRAVWGWCRALPSSGHGGVGWWDPFWLLQSGDLSPVKGYSIARRAGRSQPCCCRMYRFYPCKTHAVGARQTFAHGSYEPGVSVTHNSHSTGAERSWLCHACPRDRGSVGSWMQNKTPPLSSRRASHC